MDDLDVLLHRVLRRNTHLDTHFNIGKGTETDRVSLSVWPHLHRRI